MLEKDQALELARRHGYRDADDPRNAAEEAELAKALWKALEERESRKLTEWRGIRLGARETIAKVVKEY